MTSSIYYLSVGWGLPALWWAQLGLAANCTLDPDVFPELGEFGFWHLQPKSSDEHKIAQTKVEPEKRKKQEDFPGGPVLKTPCFHCRGRGFDPWSGS